MTSGKPSLTKLANNLYRCTQAYTNMALSKYQLSSGTYPFLLTLYVKEGISQNQISRELNIDKAMSARAIQKLSKLGYLKKEGNNDDSRAYKLFLTDMGKELVPLVKEELLRWNEIITKDLEEDEEEKIIDILSKVLENAIKCKIKYHENIR